MREGGYGIEEPRLEDLQRGEDGSFEQLVRAYAARLLAVARRILRHEEDARDAVQDAFLQAFRKIDGFKGESKLGTWLHRIAINASLMRLRASKNRPVIQIEELLPQFHADGHRIVGASAWHEPGDLSAERAETRELVRRSIDSLPDDHRLVLLLRDVEQLDTNETARALGISTGAVKTRLHRARQALRRLLEKNHGRDAL